jgi:DNA-directed RNA polymerase subunit F
VTQNIHNQNTYNTQYLTIEKAMELMEDKANSGQLLSEPSQEALKSLYNLDSIEDIRAKNTDEGVVGIGLPKVNEELLTEALWIKDADA